MKEENVPSNQKPCFFCKKKKSYTGQWFYYPCKHAFHAICALINHEQIGRRTVCFTCPKCGFKRITKLCQDYDEWEKYVCMSYCLEREFQQKQKKKKKNKWEWINLFNKDLHVIIQIIMTSISCMCITLFTCMFLYKTLNYHLKRPLF